jgi:hypothetical protein
MSKRDEINHERFEELCALVALGQISADEYADLRAHLTACDACRRSRQDFLEILHEHLPLVAGGESYGSSSKVVFHDSSYKQRFLQRTHEGEGVLPATALKGVESTARPGVWTRGWQRSAGMARYALPVAAALLVAALGFKGFQWYQSGETGATSAVELNQLREEINQLNLQIAGQSLARDWSSIAAAPSKPVTPEKPTTDADQLVEELAQARSEWRRALANLRSQSQMLQQTQGEADAMRTALEEAWDSTIQLSEKLATAEQALQSRTSELEAIKQQDSPRAVTIAVQKSQITELTRKLSEQAQTIKRERELLTAGRDIRDLMGARNLHMIDVVDVDGSGERRLQGRVFYTEGRSLIFYAYDMPRGKNSLDNHSLQAWGQRGTSRTGSAESLGIFYMDDRNEDQWMLEYDDPEVLAQIDSVFVTLEPKEGSLKPQGQKLMYAYLKATPNHP